MSSTHTLIRRRLSTTNGAGVIHKHTIKSHTNHYSQVKTTPPSSPAATSPQVQSACLASLVPLLTWIHTKTPCFHVKGKDVQVLYKPSKFYRTLKSQILAAKHRIVIASLYLGTGPLEKDLVDCLQQAMDRAAAEGRDLSVTILLDYQRGTRGTDNSCTMLQPLVDSIRRVSTASSAGRVSIQVALYHTPDLRGIVKSILPERLNEIIGIQHLKVYLFDDDLILSGANLSDSYFTNRQDRYILFQDNSELCHFFERLVQTVASMSFHLVPGGELVLSPDLDCHPFEDDDDGAAFRKEAAKRIEAVIEPDQYKTTEDPANDTCVYPLIQMTPLGVGNDVDVTSHLLASLPEHTLCRLATGYFNLTTDYCDTILKKSSAHYSVLTAAPQANGFYGAEGLSKHIPEIYTHIASKFTDRINKEHVSSRVALSEYDRDGWTFHGKGIWCYLPGQAFPALTFIGSPNFGYRSVYRDLEAQAMVVTSNLSLQKQLHQEQDILYCRSQQVDTETFKHDDRYVPIWVRCATYFIHSFF